MSSEQALAIKPRDRETLSSWGLLLTEQARRARGKVAARLFASAVKKYKQALAIKSDDPDTLDNWGFLLMEQGKRARGKEASRLFAEAESKMLRAAEKSAGQTYNLACLASLRGEVEKCREYLQHARSYHGMLPSAEHLRTDTDLDSVRGRSWFREILGRRTVTVCFH